MPYAYIHSVRVPCSQNARIVGGTIRIGFLYMFVCANSFPRRCRRCRRRSRPKCEHIINDTSSVRFGIRSRQPVRSTTTTKTMQKRRSRWAVLCNNALCSKWCTGSVVRCVEWQRGWLDTQPRPITRPTGITNSHHSNFNCAPIYHSHSAAGKMEHSYRMERGECRRKIRVGMQTILTCTKILVIE